MIGESAMCRAIVLFLLAISMPRAGSQFLCQMDDHCSVGYYCNEHLNTCSECVTCENFKPGDSCAKSVIDCGSASDCLDGYKYIKDGKCIPASNTSTVIVAAVSMSVAVVVLVAGAVHVLRRKREILYINPDTGANLTSVQAVSSTLEAEYLGGPPPPYNHSIIKGTFSPINSAETNKSHLPTDLNESTEPLLYPEAIRHAGQLHTEHMQRAALANPPCYVRCPVLPHSVNPQREEQMPSHEDIPLHDVAVQPQEPLDEANEQLVAQVQPTPQQPQLQITLNINNNNSTNLLSLQHQEQ